MHLADIDGVDRNALFYRFSGSNPGRTPDDQAAGLAAQQAVGQDYVIMWRQKASDLVALAAVVFPDDVETIRRDLEEGCKQLRGLHYQICCASCRP